MDPLIITCAVVGAEVMREHNPHVPYTPAEIAAEAIAAARAGAAMVHLHARWDDGAPTQDAAVYREIIDRVRAACDVIIQVSTGGAVGMTADERLQPLSLRPEMPPDVQPEMAPDVRPEMATLTTGTVNFGDGVFWNPPDLIERFARAMVAKGVRPEIEVFEVGHIANALRLVRDGILTLPLHFDFVMGVPGGIPGEPRHLVHLVDSLPPGCTWSVAGVGRAQLPLNTMAVLMGGHVRVGFEDNLYYRKGELATGNAQLVARVARIAGELNRKVATPFEARRILGLPARSTPQAPQGG